MLSVYLDRKNMNTYSVFAFMIIMFYTGSCKAVETDSYDSMPVETNTTSHKVRLSNHESKPEKGQPLNLDLGRYQTMRFIWIKALNMWVGQFEVTNAQYRRFDGEHESENYHGLRLNSKQQPVVSVSWSDACNYCAWLNRNFRHQLPTGYECRLPTEKEWETFAQCGDGRKFPWGNQWPPSSAWNYRGEEASRGIFKLLQHVDILRGHQDNFIASCPVQQSGANEWSLYGVGGNVWEWCQDWFDKDRITRVLRGASWGNYQQKIIAITYRNDANPYRDSELVGFRVVIGPIGL